MINEDAMNRDKFALISQKGEQISYKNLVEFCDAFNTNFNKRSLLLIRCEVCIEVIMAYVAALRGKVPMMMVESNVECDEIVFQYEPEYIWQNVKLTITEGYKVSWSRGDFVLLKKTNQVCYEINDELALLLSTSGSTGSAKFVRISYKNIEFSTKVVADSLNIQEGNVAIVTLPLAYIYGLSVINTYLYVGATLLIPYVPMIQKSFWDFFKEYAGTFIYGVPYTYEVIRKLNILSRGLTGLKLMAVAGGKISQENERYMLDMSIKYGFDFASMYGQTEATGRISTTFLNRNIDKFGSAGQVISGGRIDIQDDEIIYYGENVAMGYANGYKDLCKGDEWKGVLKTGDVGCIDEDGFVYINGRKKRIAKINGYRLSLDEVEKRLSNSLSISCVCIEKSDRLYVVYEDGEMNVEMMKKELERITHLHKNCFDIKAVSRIPRNSSGKIMYEEIL